MNIQEPLTGPRIQQSDFRISFIARFLAVEDVDAQLGEDRTEVLVDLLLRGLLLEVTNKNLHRGELDFCLAPNGRSSRHGKTPWYLVKEDPIELRNE